MTSLELYVYLWPIGTLALAVLGAWLALRP